MANSSHPANKRQPAALDAQMLARTLGGKVFGRNRILAPGPGHSSQDRSLSVSLDPSAPDGFLVHSFAGDDPIACRDHVRALARLPAWAPSCKNQAVMPRPIIVPAKPTEDEERNAAWLQSRIRALWDEGHNPCGSIVQTYLEGRALALPDEVAGSVLRFHPDCPWKDERGQLIRVPAMIAAMRCIHTDRLKAVHRTRLTPDGKKVDRRMLGDATEAAIKLDADDMVTGGLTIGEGIETVLAARQLGFKPAWATGSVSTMGTFPVLSGIEVLTLLTEEDKKGANAKAVQTCGTRWHEAGREVITVASKTGGDVNDAIKGRAA
jgi:putative DNA primase/helicase